MPNCMTRGSDKCKLTDYHIDGLMQNWRNSYANASKLRLFYIKSSVYTTLAKSRVNNKRAFPYDVCTFTVSL